MMKNIWLILVPDLVNIHASRRAQALKQASQSDLQSGELAFLAVWLVIVGFLTHAILGGATAENKLLFTVVTNLVFTAPSLLLAFVPIHLRRIKRDIRRQLAS